MARIAKWVPPAVLFDEKADPLVTQLRHESGAGTVGDHVGWSPVANLLPPKLVTALGETMAACRVPQRTETTQRHWAVLARVTSEHRETFGVLTTDAGGLRSIHSRYFNDSGWPESTFMQNIAAWNAIGLVAERKEKHGKRPAVTALWVPSLSETMVWTASHRAHRWASGRLSLAQVWRLALDAVSHHAYPPSHIVPPRDWAFVGTPRHAAGQLISRIRAYEKGYGDHPCRSYWADAVVGADGFAEYLKQRDEAIAFLRGYDGKNRFVQSMKAEMTARPFQVLDLTEGQIGLLLRIRDETENELIPLTGPELGSEQHLHRNRETEVPISMEVDSEGLVKALSQKNRRA